MDSSVPDMMSFDSERSLGPTGDGLFLEIRHHILTAHYAPRQLIDPNRLATNFSIPRSAMVQILRALRDHGYLIEVPDHRFCVIAWSDAKFCDLLEACQDLIGVAIAKCMTRIDVQGLQHLASSVAFAFQDPIDENQLESFQMRWWIFWQTIISSIEVRNFRKMMLTGMPPAFRRRVVTSLDPAGLRSMLFDMQALVRSFEARDAETGQGLLVHQFAELKGPALAANQAYNALASDSEISYDGTEPLRHPIFREASTRLPPFGPGLREPLSWADYEALNLRS
jgi:DNA-binding GntR family transcriptional regulator